MHEYPPHDFYDSVTRSRVNALGHLGFTERQRQSPTGSRRSCSWPFTPTSEYTVVK